MVEIKVIYSLDENTPRRTVQLIAKLSPHLCIALLVIRQINRRRRTRGRVVPLVAVTSSLSDEHCGLSRKIMIFPRCYLWIPVDFFVEGNVLEISFFNKLLASFCECYRGHEIYVSWLLASNPLHRMKIMLLLIDNVCMYVPTSRIKRTDIDLSASLSWSFRHNVFKVEILRKWATSPSVSFEFHPYYDIIALEFSLTIRAGRYKEYRLWRCLSRSPAMRSLDLAQR